MATIELSKQIKFIKEPLKIKTEKACLCAGEFKRKVDGEVRSFFSPMIYIPVPAIEFDDDEEGIQSVHIVEESELEGWLSFSRQVKNGLYIRGPHHHIISSAIRDKGYITIEPI